MAVYGEKILGSYQPEKESFYDLITIYFENPLFTKVKQNDNYDIYMAKINASLLIEYRYLVAVTYKTDEFVGHTEYLKDLKWVSFQTRTLKDEHNIKIHNYFPKRLRDLEKKITLIKVEQGSYTYSTENAPITVTLLGKQKNSSLEYSKSGSLLSALETFNTIISWS